MLRAKNINRKQEGFTLIEVLVSMAIFMIGAMGVIGLLVYVMRGHKQSFAVTGAMSAGRAEMERIMALDTNSLNDCKTSTGTCEPRDIYVGGKDKTGRKYTVKPFHLSIIPGIPRCCVQWRHT